MPGALVSLSPGSLLSRSAIAAALMVFSALTIQQFGGAIEAHFGIPMAGAVLTETTFE